jgi:hypothetical protein
MLNDSLQPDSDESGLEPLSGATRSCVRIPPLPRGPATETEATAADARQYPLDPASSVPVRDMVMLWLRIVAADASRDHALTTAMGEDDGDDEIRDPENAPSAGARARSRHPAVWPRSPPL